MEQLAPPRRWPGYNAVWRWHFYAGLFCIPFVLWLACTGSIYLWRPQVEALIGRPYAHFQMSGPRASSAAEAEAAVRSLPGSRLKSYELPSGPDAAAQILVEQRGRLMRVYVHPQSLAILTTVQEDRRLMRIIFTLHGELMMGNRGSYAVELAASWAIVMILSGLFLWWPRASSGMAGVLYPRLRSGRRRFWRDLHGVTGFWVSFFALFLLISGLPWAKSWGTYLQTIRTVAEGQIGPQDWTSGHEEHEHHGGGAMTMRGAVDYGAIDRIAATVRPLGLAAPVLISPPAMPGMAWIAKSDAANRPQRETLLMDPDGTMLSRQPFAQRDLVDRIVGYGVAVHEGQLFGLANQLLGLFTAIGLILLSVSSVILWWRRKPADVLGAPPANGIAPLAAGFFGLLFLLGISLPLFGASLIITLVIEQWVLRSLPKARHWLGLTPRSRARAPSASLVRP